MENTYITKIKNIGIPNKYTKWYCNIILKALERDKPISYLEKHHILPKSFKLGGERDKENMVNLTLKEHFICHLLLTKMLTDEKSRK
jgi:hypothetical protein